MAPKNRARQRPPAVANTKRAKHGASNREPPDNSLERVLGGLSLDDFESGGMRVTHSVPGRSGPYVAALDIIKVATKTKKVNATERLQQLKKDHPEVFVGSEHFKFPGQGQSTIDVVDLKTALQIIMLLPGAAAAAVRLKASVLLVRFLGGDLSLIAEVYDMNALQEHLKEQWPEHPLARFAEAARSTAGPTAPGDGGAEAARSGNAAVQQVDAEQLTVACSNALTRAVPQLFDRLRRHLDERIGNLACRFETHRGGSIVNLNVRAPKRAPQQVAVVPAVIAPVGGGRPFPVAKFLDEKQRSDESWAPIRRNFVMCFSHVAQALMKKNLSDAGLCPQYVQQNHRPQIYYAEADRPVLEEAWELTRAHREELVAMHRGEPQRLPVRARASVVELLRGAG